MAGRGPVANPSSHCSLLPAWSTGSSVSSHAGREAGPHSHCLDLHTLSWPSHTWQMQTCPKPAFHFLSKPVPCLAHPRKWHNGTSSTQLLRSKLSLITGSAHSWFSQAVSSWPKVRNIPGPVLAANPSAQLPLWPGLLSGLSSTITSPNICCLDLHRRAALLMVQL